MDKNTCNKCSKNILEGLRFCPFCGAEQRVKRSSSTFNRTPFEILQITPDAEEEVIKAAYRSLAKKYHPDMINNGTSEKRIKELNWAYSELSDPESRKKWSQKEKPTHQPKASKTEPIKSQKNRRASPYT